MRDHEVRGWAWIEGFRVGIAATEGSMRDADQIGVSGWCEDTGADVPLRSGHVDRVTLPRGLVRR